MPRKDIPGKAKSMKIRHFLSFLSGFTNDLPIFLESQICENYEEIAKFRSLNYQKMMTVLLGSRRNYPNELSISLNFLRDFSLNEKAE